MLQNYHEALNLNLLTGVLSQLQIQDLATVDNDLQMSLQLSMVFGQVTVQYGPRGARGEESALHVPVQVSVLVTGRCDVPLQHGKHLRFLKVVKLGKPPKNFV